MDLEHAVQGRMRAYLADTSPDPHGIRAVVASFGALPLVLDMSGCYALRLDGVVIAFSWDEPHGLVTINDERLRNVALYQGSLKYPELASLVPARAPDAIDCRSCGGIGKVSVDGHTLANVVCFCGGLGWVPAGSASVRTPVGANGPNV